MFLNARGRYSRDGEQIATGPYLWVVLGPDGDWYNARAFVRSLTLRQCGHFMSGQIRVGGHHAYVEGAYGSNGLPGDAPPHVYQAGIPVPRELMVAWNAGGGHNGPGSEAHSMRHWAIANLDALRKAGRNLPSNHRDRLAGILRQGTTAHPLSALRDRILGPINPAAYQWPSEELSKLQRGREEIFLDRVISDALALGLTEAQIAAHPWRAASRVLESWRESA